MKKVFTLLTLALLSIGSAWADTEVSPEGGSSNAEVKGTSFTIDGTFNAGSGVKLANMQTKGIKIRCNRADNTLKIQVNDGYTINSVDIYIASNDKPSKLSVTGITVDGTAYTPGGVTYPLEVAAKDVSNDATVIAVATPATDNITLSFGGTSNGTGTQGIMELHVDYTSNATLPHINAEDASITATKSGVEVTEDIAVTGANLTGSTLTATLSPAVSGLSVTLASNTITAGAISTTATLHYTATENASGSTTLTLSDGTTAKAVTINYSANVKTWVLQTISEAKTWDFSKLSGGKEYTGDDLNVEHVYAGITEITPTDASFDATALAFKGQYPLREGKAVAQNGTLRFNTSVSGVVTVKFSDTGTGESADAYRRYLCINGTKTEFWVSRPKKDDATYESRLNQMASIPVSAGDVTISGVKEDGTAAAALTVSLVEFSTETTVAKTIAASGKSTFSSAAAVDFSGVTGLEAYTVSALSATSATLTKVTEAPANTGLLLIGTPSATYNIPIVASAEAVGTNFLKAAVANKELAANSAYVLKDGLFCLATKKGSITAGKAYLLKSDVPSEAAELSFDFDGDGTGEISTGIENVEAQKGFLDGEFYNLNGQRVAQPTKGLYIVNGRKVIIK